MPSSARFTNTNLVRSVAAVVDLKNRVTTWHLAKKISLTAGQTDIKVEFPLPILACNIMIEYSDFYENIQVGQQLSYTSYSIGYF